MGQAPDAGFSELEPLRRRIADLEAAREQQVRTEDALRGALFNPELTFFDTLVTELARATGADVTTVGELLPGGTRVRTLSLFSEGRIVPDLEYDLAGTPGANVIGRDLCVIPRGVADQFPGDPLVRNLSLTAYAGIPLFDMNKRPSGLISVLARRPFAQPAAVESILRVAAIRASSELDRCRAESLLKTVFESTLLGIVSWTAEGEIREANDYILEVLGFERDELRAGKVRWKDLTPPEFAARD
ncbi:MAG TPA: GAF domain-containing protein, partial [Planctomycetota bacterium]|nr:GAF domain-containing protein [Planctomycetota bacterium]